MNLRRTVLCQIRYSRFLCERFYLVDAARLSAQRPARCPVYGARSNLTAAEMPATPVARRPLSPPDIAFRLRSNKSAAIAANAPRAALLGAAIAVSALERNQSRTRLAARRRTIEKSVSKRLRSSCDRTE